jgi:hypothetical protein
MDNLKINIFDVKKQEGHSYDRPVIHLKSKSHESKSSSGHQDYYYLSHA